MMRPFVEHFPVPVEVLLQSEEDPLNLREAQVSAYAPGMVWVEVAIPGEYRTGHWVRATFRDADGNAIGMETEVVWSESKGRVALKAIDSSGRMMLAQWGLGQSADLRIYQRITQQSLDLHPELPDQDEEACYKGCKDMPWNLHQGSPD